eukprot:TRINITY_DN1255_c0_g2_i1.p1 TRINITY_DN1255_c0_g2~~TRINITY_DN1255_c0_g2_i1.p1  ORF type:complete len:648 (-),score=54.65 TRINITY_DN1255_c0_g2_i1:460-2403(-)
MNAQTSKVEHGREMQQISNQDTRNNGNVQELHYQVKSSAYVTWKDLQVTVTKGANKGKRILDGVSGYVEPCNLLALMGASGSGKTTLLDTLAGRLSGSATVTGNIYLNGKKSNLSYGKTAYVTQDDVFTGTLTVRETIGFSAFLRLPPSQTHQEKVDLINDTIRELGLEDVADTYLGNWHLRGVSGGQRRRVKVGQELVVQPSLMFLDEPTTGLDAAAAYYFGALMRKICCAGRTILMVIHQPSSELFEQFDDLCLLAGGKVVYFGRANAAANMFATVGFPAPSGRSISDHLLHCVNRDFQQSSVFADVENDSKKMDIDQQIEMLQKYYQQQLEPAVIKRIETINKTDSQFIPNENLVGPITQCGILIQRNFLNMLRNMGIFWLRLVMYVILCVCLGTIFIDLDKSWNDVNARAAVMFYIVSFLTFMSVAGFPAFIEDMKVFLRERLNGYYGVGVFSIANTITSAPFLFLISILSSLVMYWAIGLNDEGDRFPYFVLDLWISLLVVESLMMAIAAIVPHFLMGIAAGAGLLGIYMSVGGFLMRIGELPDPVWKYPMHYIAYHTYSFSGFMNNEFRDTYGWACPCSIQYLPDGSNACEDCTQDGDGVLESWQIPDRKKYLDLGILIGMIVVYRFIFYGMLKLKEALAK